MKTERLTRKELTSLMVDHGFLPRSHVAQLDRIADLYEQGVPERIIGIVVYVITGRGRNDENVVGSAIRAAEREKSRPALSPSALKATLTVAGYSAGQVNAVTKAITTHPDAGKAYRITA